MGERIERVTADDGARLWTVRSGPDDGSGHGFLLCHGGPGFWDTLGPIAEMLADLGPVVRWDQRGGGRSQWLGPYTLERFLTDLDQVRQHHGFARTTLIGHSFGATLALRYALNRAYRDHVRRLVYVAGVGLGWAWQDEHGARARLAAEPYAARTAELHAIPTRTPEQDRELDLLQLAKEFPDRERALELAATQVVEVFPDDGLYQPITAELRTAPAERLVEQCRDLHVPTLIIDGARDLRPRWSVDSLAEALPDRARVELAEAGHFPWLDEPAAFAAELRAFVGG